MISNHLEEGVSFLKQHSVPEPEISASFLLSYVRKQPALSLMLNLELKLTNDEEKEFESLLIKRAARYPLQYLMKCIPFRNAVLEIGPECLIPRPETELLVETALNTLGGAHGGPSLHILDVGTGSGNIAISLAMERPHWRFTATDVSEDALQYARKNGVLNHTHHQINFVKADLLNGVEGKFDVVISNPPYLKTEDLICAQAELSFEPATALDGGKDGLSFYRRIIKDVKSVLRPGGFLFFEIGHDQAKDVSDFMKHEFAGIEVVDDYAGHKRIILGCLNG